MARLIGPDDGSRLVYQVDIDGRLGSAARMQAVVYAAATGPALADILTEDGDPIPGSVLTVDETSLLPLFQFPDRVSVVWVAVIVGGVEGPRTPIYAQAENPVDSQAKADAARSAATAAATAAGRSASGGLRQSARLLAAIPAPERPVPALADGAGYAIRWMSADGATLFGANQLTLARSTNDGASWSSIKVFSRAITGIRQMANGELLVTLTNSGGPGEVWRSTGYPAQGAGATWAKVLTTSAATNYIEPFWGLSVTGGNIIVASEYGDKVPPTNPRYVYLSQDYGGSWATVFDMGALSDAHVHGSAWDPYWERIWVVTGDVGNRSIRFSDDLGQTWVIVSQGTGTDQPVGILPMPNCVLFLTDSTPNGVLRIWRRDKAELRPPVEVAYLADTSNTLTLIGGQPYWRGEGYPALLPFTRSTPGPGLLVATFDGVDFFEVWRDSITYSTPRGLETALGPTATGKIVGGIFDNRYAGSRTRLTLAAPTRKVVATRPPGTSVQTYARSTATRGAALAPGTTTLALTDLDLRIKVAADTWTPGAEAALIAKYTGSDGNRSWYWVIRTDGRLQLKWYPLKTSASIVSAISSVAPTVTAGRPAALRVTLDTDTGSGGWLARFYQSSDDGVTWIQFGTDVTGTPAQPIPATETTSPISVGAGGTAADGQVLTGRFFWASVRGAIDGDIVAEVDFSSMQWSPGDVASASPDARNPSYVDRAGMTWALPTTTQIVSATKLNTQAGADIPVITGSRGSATAAVLASTLQALADAGIVVDQTTA